MSWLSGFLSGVSKGEDGDAMDVVFSKIKEEIEYMNTTLEGKMTGLGPGHRGWDLIDWKNRKLVDCWGRRLVLLFDTDGHLIAIGSMGANGRWDEGQEDDIVVEIR